MEIGEWLEQLAYNEASFKDKSVWVTMKAGGKLGMVLFSIPFSLMIPFSDGSLYKRIEFRGKPHILYKMTKGAHNSCTWGKKKEDGTRMFKSNKNYGGGGSNINQSSGRTRGNKQYFCKKCNKQTSIERDKANNAYCVDFCNKMFG